MQKSGGKRKKHVNLLSQEGTDIATMKLPGRRKCDCQAAKHALVTNCLSCGRIVCEQEGAGPCLFCDTMVGSSESSASARGGSAGGKGKAAANDAALLRATQHKNTLLERDRDGTQRAAVIDDESDYFQTGSSWLNPRQRQAVERYQQQLRREKDARNRTFTLDFAGREVSTQEVEVTVNPTHINTLIQELAATELNQAPPLPAAATEGNNAPAFRPEYRVDPRREADVDKLFRERPASQLKRVQDAPLQLLSDDGMCLSMHQPWASLLTAGIKIHEGRSWYTPYRGRLWIAAAGKVPTPQEIKEVEDTYRVLSGKELSFPEFYPPGCLLGRVNVLDCLPQEVYSCLLAPPGVTLCVMAAAPGLNSSASRRTASLALAAWTAEAEVCGLRREQFPDGESDSPYVLICSDPEQLLVKFPMKGQHKIYKMDSNIHKAAKKMITAG